MPRFMALYSIANKCVAMTFRVKGMRPELVPSLSLCNSQLAVVGQVKYLDVVIDSLLCDDNDILRQLRYQYCSANKLRASFFKCSIFVKNICFGPTALCCMQLIYDASLRSLLCNAYVWRTTIISKFYMGFPSSTVLVHIRWNGAFRHSMPFCARRCMRLFVGADFHLMD